MSVSPTRVAWISGLVVLLLGLGITLAICADAPPQPPAYLATATYITSAKCRMCHGQTPVNGNKGQYAAWLETTHAKFATQLPWEGKAEPPTVGEVYRHVTGYNPATKTWAEKGVACEACHGPGSMHFHPPAGEARKNFIVNPATLATPGQKISVCGRCHGQYTMNGETVALNYKAGQDLTTTEGFKLDAVDPGKPMEQMNELIGSQHYAHGVTCITCHTAHTAGTGAQQLRKPIIEQCESCHKDKTMAGHAPNAPAGSTCATCHMPKGVHTFTKPAK